ncbi:MAG: hypothetical protein JNM58_05180 [Xanthomonadaceae bacterium]|nr:hypothetical protein [Xanthomonadaceae bacterium]
MNESSEVVGRVSFLINVARGEVVDDAVLEDARDAVAARFTKELKRHRLDEVLVIQAVESRRGCIIVEIVIGGGALLLLKDYKSYRESLILLVKDLNGARIALKRLGERTMWLFRHDLPGIDDKLSPVPPDDTQ